MKVLMISLMFGLVPTIAQANWVDIGSYSNLRLVHEEVPTKGFARCLLYKLLAFSEETGERLIWAACDWHQPKAFPWAIRSGAVVPSPDGETVYILIARTFTLKTLFHFIEIDVKKHKPLTLKYDKSGNLKNTHALYEILRKPKFLIRKGFPLDEKGCGFDLRIKKTAIVGNTLIITMGRNLATRRYRSCVDKVLKLDLALGRWIDEESPPQENQKEKKK